MADLVKVIFAKPIHLAIQVFNIAGETSDFYSDECSDIEKKTVRLLAVLRKAAKASTDLHERATRVIIDDTNQVLEKAHALLLSCRSYGFLKRVFLIIHAKSFRNVSELLENSIGSVTWLLRVSRTDKVEVDFTEGEGRQLFWEDRLILYLIWDMSAAMIYGSQMERHLAARSLASLARDQTRYRKQIIEEGTIGPLLKLVEDDENPQGQHNAVEAIGELGKDPEDVEHLIQAGVCSVFTEVFKKEGAKKKLHVMAAWAISELAGNYPKCQDRFAQHGIVSLLVNKLALETVDQEHSTESTDTEGEAKKEFIVKALRSLAVDNSAICRSITESKAMLCFADLLERGNENEQYESAMALMEVTAMVEKETDLARFSFKPKFPARQAIVDQLLNIFNRRELDSRLLISRLLISRLLIPCVKSIGNLARTCSATETRMILPLARLVVYVSEVETKGIPVEDFQEIVREVLIVLSRAVCHENIRCTDHSEAILNTGAVKHLVQMAYFGTEVVNIPSLILLSYISSHVPENEELAKHNVLRAIEWAERQVMSQNHTLMKLLPEAKSELELYQ